MIKPVYTVLDEVAGFYSPIFTAENDKHAIRMFLQSIDLNHAHDFTLFCIGSFDNDKGVIVEKTPTLVMQGASVKKEKAQ